MKVAVVSIATDELMNDFRRRSVPDVIIYRKIEKQDLLIEFNHVKWIDYSADLAEGIR